MGKKSQAHGAAFEKRLGMQINLLRRTRKAAIRRVKPPMSIVGKQHNGVFPCRHSGEHTVDYEGTLAGGRAVYFDAKSSSGKVSFSFSGVRDSQIDYLAEHARMGALCFLVVERTISPRERAEYVLPVCGKGRIAGVAHKRSLEVLESATRESVKWSELDEGGWRAAASETWADVVARQGDLWLGEGGRHE
jgi:penicillin-binding protein-related factor A (putative recombinase)